MRTPPLANRYHVQRTLGEGAMGLVLLATDATTGQDVALKVVSQQLGLNEQSLLQFKQEFRLMAQLQHPNCCAVQDYGVLPGGEPYFTMEVVPGHGVDERLPYTSAQTRAILAQLLLALGYVHERGYLHRDIKAANVRVRPDGTVKLMDFGLMERAGRATGTITGTVGYIAPEVVKRGAVDQRADLYAVGCLAFEMLTGTLPFTGETPLDVLRAHVNALPPPLGPEVDPELARVIRRLLAKEPLERYQSAFDTLEALGAEVPAGLGGSLLTSPFVGRVSQLQQLETALAALGERAPGGPFWAHGPQGVGKSRMITEFRYRVQLENLPCAIGAAHQRGASPYGPIVALLKTLLPTLRAHVPDTLDRHAGVLVKLLPELQASPQPDLDPPSRERLRLESAIIETLAALAAETGCVLLLEDFQWADAQTLAFWPRLRRLATESPVLLLVTSRQAPDDEAVIDLPLASLEAQEISHMVSSMLGTEQVDAAFLAQVGEISGGNPLFVEELLDHLVRKGGLVRAGGTWNTAELPADRLPRNLSGMLRAKLDALSPPARLIARAGAVAGHTFGLDLLQYMTGLSDQALFDALDQLTAAGILLHGEWGRYHFAHDEHGHVIEGDLQPEERRHLHRAAAEALELQLGFTPLADAPLELVTAIADHYLAAEVPDRLITYTLEAGMRHAALFATEEAERFLAAGLAASRASDHEPSIVQLSFLRALGDLKRVMGNLGGAADLYDAAISLARSLNEQRTLGHLLTSTAKVLQSQGDLRRALEQCQASLNVSLAAGEPTEAARSLLTSCRLHYFSGDVATAVADTERALALSRETGDQARLGEALSFLGYLYATALPGRQADGIAHLDEAVALLTGLGDPLLLINAYILLGNVQRTAGHFSSAREAFFQAQRIAKAIEYRAEYATALLNVARTDIETGAFSDAEEAAAGCQTAAAALQSGYLEGLAMAVRALAMSHLGLYLDAQALFAQAQDFAERQQMPYMEAIVREHEAEGALQRGDAQEAVRLAEAALALLNGSGQADQVSQLEALIGEALGRLGKGPEGRARAEAALAEAERAHAPAAQIRAQRVMAWLALQEQAWDEAHTRACAARDLAASIGAHHQAASAEALLGEIALATGRTEAEGHYRAAADWARAAGVPLLLAEATFGLAAACPNGEAAETARSACDTLLALVEGWPEAARLTFLSLRERTRVANGNYAAFGLPIADRPSTGPLNLGMRFGQGGW